MTVSAPAVGRFMVVAYSAPFRSSGTNIVLRRLLENLTPEEVVVVARGPGDDPRIEGGSRSHPYVAIPALPREWRGDRYWRLASVIPGIWLGRRAVGRYHPGSILAVFPDETSLLTGYWLHRATGLPLLAYFCDLYMEDRRTGWPSRLARWLQPRVFSAASRILAVNEGMREFYDRRYGLDAVCLPACINDEVPEFATLPNPGDPFVVGYSGSVNETRFSSLKALVRAIGDDPHYAIRYFTPQKPEFLRAQGLWSANASAKFIGDEAALMQELSRCDAQFLPLTFSTDTNSHDQLSTCFGIKSYEYFLSRRPIVLHSPGDYFIARFYRQWDCGVVVDDPSPAALRRAIEGIRSDTAARERVVRNSLRVAAKFDGKRIVATLRKVIGEVSG